MLEELKHQGETIDATVVGFMILPRGIMMLCDQFIILGCVALIVKSRPNQGNKRFWWSNYGLFWKLSSKYSQNIRVSPCDKWDASEMGKPSWSRFRTDSRFSWLAEVDIWFYGSCEARNSLTWRWKWANIELKPVLSHWKPSITTSAGSILSLYR